MAVEEWPRRKKASVVSGRGELAQNSWKTPCPTAERTRDGDGENQGTRQLAHPEPNPISLHHQHRQMHILH
eukprot:6193121-Pleurochrysis_carterae.AAC.2